MSTITKIEKLSIEVYDETNNFTHVVLDHMKDTEILLHL